MPHEPDDWSDPGAPLPPEDRLWRHPSELARGASSPVTVADADPRRGRRRGLVALAVLSGITGATATVVALAAMGTLSPRTVERVEQTRAAPVPVAASTTDLSAGAVAAAAAPGVVEITAVGAAARLRGSGVVVTAEGLILTSAALLADAETVLVTWPTGEVDEALIHGRDALTGLAAVSVAGAGSHHHAVTIDAARPSAGEAAITVAAWDGTRGPTVTQGVVSSSRAHAEPEAGRLLGLIETDRPVPDWADGGALVDASGAVRGISLAVPEQPTTGWAVPVGVAWRVARDLSTVGYVDRGWLGLRGSATDPTTDLPGGMTIDDVEPGSPAAQAGFAVGDLVVAVDQMPVRSLADVKAALAVARPGQAVRVERVRAGVRQTVSITLAETPR